MERISERKEKILKSIILSFIENPEPVGSKRLLQDSDLVVSSATVRHEMFELEQLGYIMHPHTSAGRIPTDKGYRYYVDYLMETDTGNFTDFLQSLDTLRQKMNSTEDFLVAVSQLAAVFTQQMSVIIFPAWEDLNFRYVNLIGLNGQKVLVVWTTMSGVVREKIILFEKACTDEMLKKIANFMNQEMAGQSFLEIQNILSQKMKDLRDSYHDIYNAAKKMLEESILLGERKKIWINGIRRFFEYPEFRQSEEILPLLELMENAAEAIPVFDLSEKREGPEISIGMENKLRSMWGCSLLRQSYFIQNKALGTISILGPKRMDYSGVVQRMNMVSQLLSKAFRENLSGF